MNDTQKTIAGLLEQGKPELQVAAAQVLGELRVKDPSVVRALAAGMRRSPVLARFCLDALGKIRTDEAIEIIARAAVETDSVGEHAAHVAVELGDATHPVLATAYQDGPIELRLRILGILSRQLGKESMPVFVHALLTPETTAAAAKALLGNAAQFTPALQKQLRDGLSKHLAGALPETCLSQVVAVLAAVDAEGSRPWLASLTGPQAPPVVRSAAFRALRGSKLTASQVRSMMDLLEDPAQREVHEAARDVLAGLPEVPDALLPVLKRLLVARQPEQRLFALRMLRTAGGAEIVRVAMKLLDHDDERFRAAAVECLAHNRQAIDPVLKLALTTRSSTVAEAATGILSRHREHLQPNFVRAVAEKAMKLLSTNSRLADLLFDVVMAAGAAKLATFLVERCVRLRRVGRFEDVLHVLARLVNAAPDEVEVRYQLALTKLLHDASRPAADVALPGNSAMGFVASLVRSGFPVFERLRKEAAVTPDLLLRIATHFTSAVGPERRFAADLLQHLATRTKGRAGEEARVALRAVSG